MRCRLKKIAALYHELARVCNKKNIPVDIQTPDVLNGSEFFNTIEKLGVAVITLDNGVSAHSVVADQFVVDSQKRLNAISILNPAEPTAEFGRQNIPIFDFITMLKGAQNFRVRPEVVFMHSR